MDLKTGSFLIHLLSVTQCLNDPQIKSRVYIEDYSVALQGVHVSESSWSSNRLPPTREESSVSCATACVTLFRQDVSCNSIMFVRETKECHMGYTSLPNRDEATEFVYRIPNGKGEVLLLLLLPLSSCRHIISTDWCWLKLMLIDADWYWLMVK